MTKFFYNKYYNLIIIKNKLEEKYLFIEIKKYLNSIKYGFKRFKYKIPNSKKII